MSTRRRAREVALQMLFELDFGTERDTDSRTAFALKRMTNRKPLAQFSRDIFDGVMQHRDEIDSVLSQHSANWTINRMAVIDRNILRIGCYEILHSDAPAGVVINEAIEIAKRYGDRRSPSFVNGILDRIRERQCAESV